LVGQFKKKVVKIFKSSAKKVYWETNFRGKKVEHSDLSNFLKCGKFA
jgi:hypothetical protein